MTELVSVRGTGFVAQMMVMTVNWHLSFAGM